MSRSTQENPNLSGPLANPGPPRIRTTTFPPLGRPGLCGRDGAGLLARTFNAMVDGLEKPFRDLERRNRFLADDAAKRAVQLDKDSAERVRIERELRLARIEIDHLVDKRTEELSRATDEPHGKVLETRRPEDCPPH